MEYDQQPPDENVKENLLDDADINFQFEYASQGQRFFNYLIDNLIMRFGLSYVTGTGVGMLIGLTYPGMFDTANGGISWPLIFVSILVAYINYLLYYTLCEKLFNGFTLGKFITGTRAVREDGDELTLKNAILRSLCRLVPFEVFSGFKIRPWHDEWTHTIVIKVR